MSVSHKIFINTKRFKRSPQFGAHKWAAKCGFLETVWYFSFSWWRHQMETFSALLPLCAGNSSVTGEFPLQRPVTRSFDVPFDLRLTSRLSKHSQGWWFATPSCSLWRHCNVWRFLQGISWSAGSNSKDSNATIFTLLLDIVYDSNYPFQSKPMLYIFII